MKTVLIISFFLILISFGIQESFAEENTWYIGEGLKQGDYFSYQLCQKDYNSCSEFQMDFWIEGTITVATEEKWRAQVVVYDGNKIVKGNMDLGKIAPEPSGRSSELGIYRGAFKSSVVWIAAYTTQNYELGTGPINFDAMTFPNLGNQNPIEISGSETITVPAGTFDTILLTWQVRDTESKIWVVDDFPFPIKANAWEYVSEGIPAQEFKFELLEYKENVLDPFLPIVPLNENIANQELTPEMVKEMVKSLPPKFKTPKQQTNVGILPSEVECKEGLVLIFKSSNNSPACVKPETAKKLVERGWAQETFSINNFVECVAAGNSVMESYPRQCKTSDGKHFVEEIESQIIQNCLFENDDLFNYLRNPHCERPEGVEIDIGTRCVYISENDFYIDVLCEEPGKAWVHDGCLNIKQEEGPDIGICP